MLHPVGRLPAAVYWRRRALVMVLLLSVLGGGGWLAVAGIGRWRAHATAAAPTITRPPATPALDQVVPSLAGVQTPAASTRTVPEPGAPTSGGPTAGGPCTDAMIGLSVRAPASAAVGSKPTFELVVKNASAVPCVRALDKGLQELVLLDASGARRWGSNDCLPETGSDSRTLAPGEAVSFPLEWAGTTSEPTCTAPRVAPAAGSYVLRGRLGTKVSADTPLTLG